METKPFNKIQYNDVVYKKDDNNNWKEIGTVIRCLPQNGRREKWMIVNVNDVACHYQYDQIIVKDNKVKSCIAEIKMYHQAMKTSTSHLFTLKSFKVILPALMKTFKKFDIEMYTNVVKVIIPNNYKTDNTTYIMSNFQAPPIDFDKKGNLGILD